MNTPRHGSVEGAALGTLVRMASGLVAGSSGTDGDLARAFGDAKNALRAAATRDPLDSLLVTVLGGSYLFYLAEKDTNPGVKSFWDALVFVSTSISVGYHNVFACTPAGKAIAAFVMSVGPALATRALDPTAADAAREAQASQAAIVERLDAILAALRAPAAASDAGAPASG